MDSGSHRTSLQINSSNSASERAESACLRAKRHEKAGEYKAAYEALAEFWPDWHGTPDVGELEERWAAELFLRAGAVAGWLGSADQVAGSQELGKDLISKSVEIFERVGLGQKVAEARGDLALCYWREGSYDEARIQLASGLELLADEQSDLRAILLIRAGIVEVWARRFDEAVRLYNEAAPLVELSEDHGLKGSFHIEFGLVFRRLAAPENREDYLDRALVEYAAASFHFEEAGNTRALARVENNLGYLYFTIGRYKDAHKHLDRARQLFIGLRDVGTAAQVDETRARTLLAEGRILEAEQMVKAAVVTLEKGGEQAILADALTTYGVVLARLGHYPRAKVLFERAIQVAESTGDLEGAGRSRLSIIEELRDTLPAKELVTIYRSAIELLKGSQDPATGKRLIGCADALLAMVVVPEPLVIGEDASGVVSFEQYVHEAERTLIEWALRGAGGSVTKAARSLGFKHHQSLSSIINGRHQELLKSRSAVRPRQRSLIGKGKSEGQVEGGAGTARASILHVGDNRTVARMVADPLIEDLHFESFGTREAALKALAGSKGFNLVVVDNELAGGTGLELVLRIRSLPHRRSIPIVLVAEEDCEQEAWRAGVSAFLRKPKEIERLGAAVQRLLLEGGGGKKHK